MKHSEEAEQLNQEFKHQVDRYVNLAVALNQQFDVLLDLHCKYVNAVSKPKRKAK